MTRYRVTASSLNVRARPSIAAKVVAFVRRDDVVTGLATSEDGYWQRIRLGDVRGWCSHKYLSPVAPEPAPEEFPWMRVAAAEEGVKELPGTQENPRIVEYLSSTNLGAPFSLRDETPWCSAFVNWCVERSGYEGTDSAWARSWLTWGKRTTAPRRGCIVVLSRDVNAGHVGFFVGATTSGVKVLGGNQANQVCVSTYPRERVLGFRLPGSIVRAAPRS